MYILVIVTTTNRNEAKMIAQAAIKKKLAACANILPKVESFFWWQGKIDKTNEALIFLKTTRAKFEKLIKIIKSIHSYDCPEIIALPIIAGEKNYLRWLNASIR